MLELLKKFWKEEEGQDLVEYALLLGGIALALIAGVTGLATAINANYEATATKVGEVPIGTL